MKRFGMFAIAALIGLFSFSPAHSQIVNPTNANNVLYTAPYAGAVARTQANKDAETFSVFDFIPTSLHAAIQAGTNIVNLSSYIQTAFTHATDGSTIYFPHGIYLITTGLTLTKNSVKLKGETAYLNGTLIKCGAAGLNLLTVQSYGVETDSIGFTGFETSSVYGEGTTCKGIVFLKGDATADIDGRVTRGFFDQLNTSIKATGRNLIVQNNTFQRGIRGVDIYKLAAEDNRGFVIDGNRFHVLGGASADPTVTNSTAIRFDSVDAFYNQITNNYADFTKYFFVGALGNGSNVNNNLILGGYNTAIKVLSSGTTAASNVTANTIVRSPGSETLIDGYGIHLNGAQGMLVSGNIIRFVRADGILLDNSATQNQITSNYIMDVNANYANDGTIYSGIKIEAGSNINHIGNNTIRQSLAGGMQYGINTAGNENFFTTNKVYTVTGTNDFNISNGVVAYGLTEAKYYQPRQDFVSAVPTTGNWTRGDIVANQSTAKSYPSAWLRLTTGANNTVATDWLALPSAVSVSSDKGDAGDTVQIGASDTTLIWDTPLTGNKTIALSNTDAYNGARIRIVRTVNATGAFTLAIGTLKNLTPGQWCDIEFSTTWFLSACGAL